MLKLVWRKLSPLSDRGTPHSRLCEVTEQPNLVESLGSDWKEMLRGEKSRVFIGLGVVEEKTWGLNLRLSNQAWDKNSRTLFFFLPICKLSLRVSREPLSGLLA